MFKTNYHTHTYFCDGKGSAEEIILEAISKGFNYLGFSSHSAFPFASTWHIAPRETEKYLEEVNNAASKYKDKIKILCGFEADYIPGITKPSLSDDYKIFNPDYLIGSVHYLVTEKGNFTVDDKTEEVKKGIEKYYNGNGKKCVQEYFYAQRQMLKNCDFTIWGHPDLVRKRNDLLHFFDEKDDWYRKEIKETVIQASKTQVIAEINTGAMARKAMNDVYPSQEFLALLYEYHIPITISSDCHEKQNLDFAFDYALQKAIKAGYRELAYIDEDKKIRFQKID